MAQETNATQTERVVHDEESASKQKRFYVCATCGRLKREELFELGDCTCKDCYNQDRSSVNYVEAPDGKGFVSKQKAEEK